MGRVRFSNAPKSTIMKQPIVNGKFYVSSDTKEFYCDTVDGVRIKISEIEFLNEDSDRTGLLAPLNKFYYVLSTNKLWYYNEDWNQIGPSNPLTIKVNNQQLAIYDGSENITINISKSDIGLGNVPNVATNDQTPIYTASSTLTALVSGEKLSIAMGKISKAISDLISHLSNKNNPHSVTKTQIGLGNVTNDRQIKGLSTGTTAKHVVIFGVDGYTVNDSGYTIEKSVPANAVFTDTKYTLSSFGITATSDELNILDGATVTVTELNYLDGVTSNIQNQLNGKASSSHGVHVTFSSTAPLAPGTASAGSALTVARSDHRHPLQTTVTGSSGSCTGNSATATKLQTPKTINGVSFDGSKNIEIGIDDGAIS